MEHICIQFYANKESKKNGLNIIFLLETYVSLLEKKLKIIYFELQISYAIESGPTDKLDFYFHAKVRLRN